MLATNLNERMHNKELEVFTIFKLTKFVCSKSDIPNQNKIVVIIVLEFEVMHSGAEVGCKIGSPVPMTSEDSGSSGADNKVALPKLAPKQNLLTQMQKHDAKFSHEDIMFSPEVGNIEKNRSGTALSQYFIAKEDTEEGMTGGGPVVRNMIIMNMIRKSLDKLKGTDKEK